MHYLCIQIFQVEVLQKKFDDFKTDLQANEVRLAEMNEIALQLMSLGQTEAALKIQTQIEELNTKWNSLQQMAQVGLFIYCGLFYLNIREDWRIKNEKQGVYQNEVYDSNEYVFFNVLQKQTYKVVRNNNTIVKKRLDGF